PARDRASSILHRNPSADYPEVAWANGVWIHDRAGKAYLDASSGAAVSSLGHGNATVAEAMVRSARRVPYVHSSFFANSEAEELADLLTQRSPAELDHVVFSSTGSEAVEVALKLAKQYYAARGEPARSLFIARRHSYHGGTLATLAVGHAPSRKRPFEQLLTEHPQIAPCYAYRNQQADESPEQYGLRVAGELQTTLDRVGRERVLAFLAETVSGSSLGAVPAVPGYFRAIREICTNNDILLILDEVMCGLYRCGSFAAFEEEGIAPDIFCVGKGLAAGYQPLGATIASRRVVRRIVDAHRAFAHQGTFMDHPAACGAGLATQRYILEHELEPLIRKRGEFLQELLMARCAPLGIVGDVRGRGLLRAVEFVSDRPARRALGNGEFGQQLRQRAIEQGLLVYPGGGGAPEGSGDHVLLAPPFIVQEAELEQMVDRLVRAIEACDRPPAAFCPPVEPVESLEARVAEPARVHSLLNDTVHVSHSFVLENCYAKPSDTVVLASSLIEGMGNKYSDLDAYVFCERLLHPSEVRRLDHHRVLTRQ
ncbi:MAG TPA: aspartate aminotransferase family protein, partial [Polyangiaceae bacterium]|nr:aspartate aminotransferase family protein [Polyangiaceae bacterium]